MRWENNINHDLREIDYTGDDWKSLAEDRELMSMRPCTYGFDTASELVN